MKTRFIIGSSEIDVYTHYYIYDQVNKETLFYPSREPNGKIKPVKILQKELADYCALLNKQDAEGEFAADTATLTKKAADYIDTIDSIFKAISPIRFPMSVLRASHSPNNH